MSDPLCDGLLKNYAETLETLRTQIEQFSPEDWIEGYMLERPVLLTIHIIEALDYYFRTDTEAQFRERKKRFGDGWWTIERQDLPDQAAVLAYLAEIETIIGAHFAALTDADLLTPYDAAKQFGETRLGHYVYALRHTLFHYGALNLLALQRGYAGAPW